MPRYSTLQIEKDPWHPRVARLLVNRPERLNAINEAMPHEIRAQVEWRDSGRPIPEGDEARRLAAELQKRAS